jgi:hypothetical protein
MDMYQVGPYDQAPLADLLHFMLPLAPLFR